jgi:hypothetical protein
LRTLALCLCALALSAPEALFGQAVYGSISGNVTDSSGAAVPNAKIAITDTGKGIVTNTLTNESGNYTQGHLIVGIYEIRIEAEGSRPTRQRVFTSKWMLSPRSMPVLLSARWVRPSA